MFLKKALHWLDFFRTGTFAWVLVRFFYAARAISVARVPHEARLLAFIYIPESSGGNLVWFSIQQEAKSPQIGMFTGLFTAPPAGAATGLKHARKPWQRFFFFIYSIQKQSCAINWREWIRSL